jgi:hypothetical protein
MTTNESFTQLEILAIDDIDTVVGGGFTSACKTGATVGAVYGVTSGTALGFAGAGPAGALMLGATGAGVGAVGGCLTGLAVESVRRAFSR